MAWYDRLLGRNPDTEEKLNPAQYVISRNEGLTVDTREVVTNYRNAYEQLEIVNRAVNMIVDDVADIPYTLGNQTPGTSNIVKNIRRSKVDILINNAGVWLGKEITDVTISEYQKLISINLTGVFLGTKHLMPFLKKAGEKSEFGSSIVNLSSVAGLVGSQLDPLYSMTKGGITTFTKSMAIYFGKKKYPIRINQVHPGIIETDMGKQVAEARINQNPNMSLKESYFRHSISGIHPRSASKGFKRKSCGLAIWPFKCNWTCYYRSWSSNGLFIWFNYCDGKLI